MKSFIDYNLDRLSEIVFAAEKARRIYSAKVSGRDPEEVFTKGDFEKIVFGDLW